jgi:uncharacterized protein YjgD (DUF1641 family)
MNILCLISILSILLTVILAIKTDKRRDINTESESETEVLSDAELGMKELGKSLKDPRILAEALEMLKDPEIAREVLNY